MKINKNDLIDDLILRTNNHMNEVQVMQTMDLNRLNQKPSADAWSALESLEHLNRYGDFYIPEIKKRLNHAVDDSANEYKSGWLGEYFANSVKPRKKLNKMKTFKNMNPTGSMLTMDVVSKFLFQQQELLALLQKARTKDLSKIKTSISISKFIKLRLGDTFRVVIYHNERHVAQAKRALQSLN